MEKDNRNKHHSLVLKMNSAENYKTILKAIGLYEKKISSGHSRLKHGDYPSITTTLSNDWSPGIKESTIKQLEKLIYDIIELDKKYPDNIKNSDYRNNKGKKLLDFYRDKQDNDIQE